MKTKTLFILLVLSFFAFNANAQVAISYGNVTLGNTSGQVNFLGNTSISTSSSISLGFALSGDFGWTMSSSSQSTGFISNLYGAEADYVYSQGSLCSSDESLKKNIRTIDIALPIIKKLRTVSFDYKFDRSKVENEKIRTKLQNDDKDRLGFIAQEVQKILPQSVKEKDSDSTLCIRLDDFIPLLVKGMQEQTGKIDSLKVVVGRLKASQNMLKSSTITSSENISASQAKLYQLNPNPFTENSFIKCFIPGNTIDARLLILDMQGTKIKMYKISGTNQVSVTIPGAELHPGMYTYSLVLDNNEIDSKRMILTN